MTWFYNLPYWLTCIIIIPLAIILFYYISIGKQSIIREENGKALYMMLIFCLMGGLWAFMIKTIETFHIRIPYLNIIETVEWIWLAGLLICLVWAYIKRAK